MGGMADTNEGLPSVETSAWCGAMIKTEGVMQSQGQTVILWPARHLTVNHSTPTMFANLQISGPTPPSPQDKIVIKQN